MGSCSGGGEATPWTGTLRDSAGVLIVENSSQGLWMEEEGWTLEEELRIGGLGGDLPYQFGQVGTIAPAFASFHTGYQGSLWVQPVQAPGLLSDEGIERYNFIEDFGATDWDVFDADGRYLGVVSMPPRFTPRTLLGDKIYGVARDDLDVQYIVRLRVVDRG